MTDYTFTKRSWQPCEWTPGSNNTLMNILRIPMVWISKFKQILQNEICNMRNCKQLHGQCFFVNITDFTMNVSPLRFVSHNYLITTRNNFSMAGLLLHFSKDKRTRHYLMLTPARIAWCWLSRCVRCRNLYPHLSSHCIRFELTLACYPLYMILLKYKT